MNIFLAYRSLGNDRNALGEMLGEMVKSLRGLGDGVFCSFWERDFFRKENFPEEELFGFDKKEIDRSDEVLALVDSEEKDEEMFAEMKYALAHGKKLVLAVKKGLHPAFLKELAGSVLEFDSLNDLLGKMRFVAGKIG